MSTNEEYVSRNENKRSYSGSYSAPNSPRKVNSGNDQKNFNVTPKQLFRSESNTIITSDTSLGKLHEKFKEEVGQNQLSSIVQFVSDNFVEKTVYEKALAKKDEKIKELEEQNTRNAEIIKFKEEAIADKPFVVNARFIKEYDEIASKRKGAVIKSSAAVFLGFSTLVAAVVGKFAEYNYEDFPVSFNGVLDEDMHKLALGVASLVFVASLVYVAFKVAEYISEGQKELAYQTPTINGKDVTYDKEVSAPYYQIKPLDVSALRAAHETAANITA